MMNKNVNAFLSSVTGNTELVCDGVLRELSKMNIHVSLYKNVKEFPESFAHECDDNTILLFFWCYKGGLDPINKNIISNLKNYNILCIGTMGGDSDSPYGDRIRNMVSEEIKNSGNNLISIFLCRGKIPKERTEYRHSLPKDHPSYLDDEGVRRHQEAASHPDEKDVSNAIRFTLKHLNLK